ncbi:MAG TPA: GNAT family N-acetyltransferase [Gemmatimonadaceae bacterium]
MSPETAADGHEGERTGQPNVEIRAFESRDIPEAVALWRAADGVVLRDADEAAPLREYLQRHAASSFVAVSGSRVIGTVLCGHDGRRGYLYHLTVEHTHRGRGIGRALATRALDALRHDGIEKCHLMVVSENAEAREFWSALGWQMRSDVVLMSYTSPESPNA